MFKKKKKLKLKKGSSLLEFSIILPGLCLILFAIITVAQLALARQSLEQALYFGARAASVCENYDAAKSQMTAVVQSTLDESTFGIDSSKAVIELEVVAGTTSTSNPSDITWEKGALLCCTVKIPLDGYITIGPDYMTSTMYVMLERPVNPVY